MSQRDYLDRLDLAARLATEVGAIARENRHRGPIQSKADGSLVTAADRAMQEHILAGIAKDFPDDAVCAEETVRQPAAHANVGAARFTWVVDPLDGTRNYAWDFPCVATSIAVLDEGWPVVAAIREHNLGCLFTATAGGGAQRDGHTIRADVERPPGDILVGFASSKDRLTISVIQHWAATPDLILRNTGSTAMQLAWVSCGQLAAAFGKRVMLWDVAAGALLIREAGGVITDPFGGDYLPFDVVKNAQSEHPYLAASPGLHAAMLGTVRQARKGVE